jgi:hypothetical protein
LKELSPEQAQVALAQAGQRRKAFNHGIGHETSFEINTIPASFRVNSQVELELTLDIPGI